MEAKAIKRGATKEEEVRLVEHRRAHNLLIELSGIRKPFDEIKVRAGADDVSAGSMMCVQG
jgi:formin 2